MLDDGASVHGPSRVRSRLRAPEEEFLWSSAIRIRSAAGDLEEKS